MKPTRECDANERMLRALLVIDGLCLSYDVFETPTKDKPLSPMGQFASDVYSIAHVATETCGNPHEDWLELIDERAKQLKERNTMDVEKVVQEIKDGLRPHKHDGKGLLHAMEEAEQEAKDNSERRKTQGHAEV